jgi:non-homologous end joining protein Ku
VIDAKIAGEEVVAPKEDAPPNVINLMEALRQSLERVSETKKKPAKIQEGRSVAAAGKKRKTS